MKSIACLLLAVALAACATNPATGKRQMILLSEQEEIQLGKQTDEQIRKEMGVYENAELQRYIERIGLRLAKSSHRPNLPWSFTVADSAAVNAFAIPGGFIYLTRGILPFLRDESELAAVLGHEVGHVDGRHSAAVYSKQLLAGGSLAVVGVLAPKYEAVTGLAGLGVGFMLLKYSRDNELEADQLGVGYASALGWRPEGMPGMLNTLGRLDEASGSSRGVPNWLATHPVPADRVTKIQAKVDASKTATAVATNKPEFERQLDGLVFGDSREQGFVRGSDFLHPLLRIALRFPNEWPVSNTSEQVSAAEPNSTNVAMLLQVVESATGSVEQVASTGMTKAGFVRTEGRRMDINGLEAFVGSYEGTISETLLHARAAHIRTGGRTYVVAGIAPPAAMMRLDRIFRQSFETFRALSAQEADRLQPNRLDFYVARPGDTWESIAKGPGRGAVKASSLAIMNGAQPATPPRPGDRLRVVVGGSVGG